MITPTRSHTYTPGHIGGNCRPFGVLFLLTPQVRVSQFFCLLFNESHSSQE